MGIVERKTRVLRKKELFLLKVQMRVMMDIPSPSDVRGFLESIFPCQVKLLMGPPDVTDDPGSPASLPHIQPKSREKLRRTQISTASVIALMMGGRWYIAISVIVGTMGRVSAFPRRSPPWTSYMSVMHGGVMINRLCLSKTIMIMRREPPLAGESIWRERPRWPNLYREPQGNPAQTTGEVYEAQDCRSQCARS